MLYSKDGIIGFTAARNISGVPAAIFTEVLDHLNDAHSFVTGGARGGDAAIGAYLAWKYPEKKHIVLLPWNRSQVQDWWTKLRDYDIRVQVIEMPEGTDYKYRNQKIVDYSGELVGFPEYAENDPRSQRSGTWQTIRIAKRYTIPTSVFVLREE